LEKKIVLLVVGTFVIFGAIQGVNNIVYGQDFSGLESLGTSGAGTNTSVLLKIENLTLCVSVNEGDCLKLENLSKGK
jgi:hypothetical protein